MMLTLTFLFICAVAFGTLQNSAPYGASWTIGAQASINNFRRIVGCSGFVASVLLMIVTVFVA